MMNTDDRWSMEVSVGEIDGETDAEVRMIKIDNRNFSGRGKAKLNPADRNVSVIGEEIAIARALSDLSHKLLHSAAVGVESMTHEKARLHRWPGELALNLEVRNHGSVGSQAAR